MAIGVSSQLKDRTRQPTWETVGYRTVTSTTPVFDYVTRYVTIWRSVRVLREEIYPVQWDRFVAANDERTCPECGGANGTRWEAGQGAHHLGHPDPPLHVNCRCRVEFSHWEFRRRNVWGWEQQSFRHAITDLKQVGIQTNQQVEEVKGWKYAN